MDLSPGVAGPEGPSFLALDPTKGQKRAAWRENREQSLRKEQGEFVDEEDLAVATKLVQLFVKHPHLGDFNKFPRGSVEWESRRRFRDQCMKWLKPGSVRGQMAERQLTAKVQDRDYVNTCGIRTLRNQKKKVLPFGNGTVMMATPLIGELQPKEAPLGGRAVWEDGGEEAIPVAPQQSWREAAAAAADQVPALPAAVRLGKPVREKADKRLRRRKWKQEQEEARTRAEERRFDVEVGEASSDEGEGLGVDAARDGRAAGADSGGGDGPAAAAAVLTASTIQSESDASADDAQPAVLAGPEPAHPPHAAHDQCGRQAPLAACAPDTRGEGQCEQDGPTGTRVRQQNEPSQDDARPADEAGPAREEARPGDEQDGEAVQGDEQDGEAVQGDDLRLLNKAVTCYVCKHHFMKLHHFYDRMCPTCAEHNMRKRLQTADLTGKVALLTGARLKIGYEIGLKLLRAGATVIGTTRFPRECLCRYATEEDFSVWRHRLHIYPLDLRLLPHIEVFVEHVKGTYPRLDVIINNAAQTIRRPPAFYRSLLRLETAGLEELQALLPPALVPADLDKAIHTLVAPAATPLLEPPPAPPARQKGKKPKGLKGRRKPKQKRAASSSLLPVVAGDPPGALAAGGTAGVAGLSLLAVGAHRAPCPAVLTQVAMVPEDVQTEAQIAKDFPAQDDENNQQVDLRARNTWVLPLEDVSTVEATEVHLINALAPFILNSRFKQMMSSRGEPTWIINVSSMEGRFSTYKEAVHPHTNMAKAALNMMTCTAAKDYAMAKIFMNSVDTGWVTEENPEPIARKKRTSGGFGPPLDEIDGAARVLDPIFSSINSKLFEFGKFYKDYRHSPWEYNASSSGEGKDHKRSSQAAFAAFV